MPYNFAVICSFFLCCCGSRSEISDSQSISSYVGGLRNIDADSRGSDEFKQLINNWMEDVAVANAKKTKKSRSLVKYQNQE